VEDVEQPVGQWPRSNARDGHQDQRLLQLPAGAGRDDAHAPLTVYRKLPNGDREEAPEHPLYPVLHGDDVNDEQTSAEWRETHTIHTALRGTSYSEVIAGNRGPIIESQLPAARRRAAEKLPSGQLRYNVRRDNGVWENLMPDQLFRLPGIGFNGITGQSVLEVARDSLGISLALQQYAGSSFKNGARNSGVLCSTRVSSRTRLPIVCATSGMRFMRARRTPARSSSSRRA
jgi:phage portal protein BeeE